MIGTYLAFYIILIILAISLYFFQAYVFYRICNKFNSNSFVKCLLPLYSQYLLSRYAGMSSLLSFLYVLVIISFVFIFYFPAYTLYYFVLIFVINFFLFGKISKNLGKSFFAYAIGSFLIFPVLILAFDNSSVKQSNLI
jgi:hypothetical protein